MTALPDPHPIEATVRKIGWADTDAAADWLREVACLLWDNTPTCEHCLGKGVTTCPRCGSHDRSRRFLIGVDDENGPPYSCDNPWHLPCLSCHGSGKLDPAEHLRELLTLPAEVAKLRDEVGQVMARERRIRDSGARWTHSLQRRIEKLKANIADEESFIEVLRTENAAIRQIYDSLPEGADLAEHLRGMIAEHVEIERLRDFADRAVAELARHGWGDFHYGAQPQKPEIVALVEEHRSLRQIGGRVMSGQPTWDPTNEFEQDPEAVGCCASCHHISHSACLICGMPDADCLAIVWPEAARFRQIGGGR